MATDTPVFTPEPRTLYVAAVPLGHLGDVTLRVLEALRQAPLVLCEDTRATGKLLQLLGVRRKADDHASPWNSGETTTEGSAAESEAAHAAAQRTKQRGRWGDNPADAVRRSEEEAGGRQQLAAWRGGTGNTAPLQRLLAGAPWAVLASDAGTPLVSDPGWEAVGTALAMGWQVRPLPGACAAVAALCASGLPTATWVCWGFIARSGGARSDALAEIAAGRHTHVLYEAPTRLADTLADLAAACGPDRPAAVARELTKLHEELARGTLGSLLAAVQAGQLRQQGEITLVIGPRGKEQRVKRDKYADKKPTPHQDD